MADFALKWDELGEHYFETGVDHGVLYLADDKGVYNQGVVWNGLTSVSESPEGAESNKQYADNIAYLNLTSAEEFKATINAFTYPDEFAVCDGTAVPTPGLSLGQQSRKSFGMSYRTKVGNDTEGQDLGYKLHLLYNMKAAPSEKEYATINDSPEAIEFSWECDSTPVNVGVEDIKPLSTITVDSTKVDKAKLAQLEAMLYGSESTQPKLPTPKEVIELFGSEAANGGNTPAPPEENGDESGI